MIKIALSTVLCAALATASTTMCFKKDHMDPSNIETTPLDGGECKGMFSVEDMKKQGYNINDIKITVGDNGMNYMYVFGKETVVIGDANTKAAAGTQVLTKEQLKAYLSELNEEEKLKKEHEERVGSISAGKEIYEANCKECHGNGTIKAYGKARPLVSLTKEDIEIAIRDYDLDKRKGSLAMIMKPYASMLTDTKLKNVIAYIQSLK